MLLSVFATDTPCDLNNSRYVRSLFEMFAPAHEVKTHRRGREPTWRNKSDRTRTSLEVDGGASVDYTSISRYKQLHNAKQKCATLTNKKILSAQGVSALRKFGT